MLYLSIVSIMCVQIICVDMNGLRLMISVFSETKLKYDSLLERS